MSITNPDLEVHPAQLFPARDTYGDESGPTLNKHIITYVRLGHDGGANRWSPFVAIDTSSYPKGRVISATIRLPSHVGGVLVTAGDACSIYRLRRVFTDFGATWNDYATGLPWGTPGARNTTSDIFTANKASFNLPLSVVPYLDVPATALLQDHLDSADTELGLLIEIDSSTGSSKGWDINSKESTDANEHGVSLINVSIIPEPYYTWLNEEEYVNNILDTTADVVLQMGTRTFLANDEVRVKWSGTDPTLATDFAVSSPHGLSGASLDQIITLTGAEGMTGLTKGAHYWWRVEFTSDAGTSWTPLGIVRSFGGGGNPNDHRFVYADTLTNYEVRRATGDTDYRLPDVIEGPLAPQ